MCTQKQNTFPFGRVPNRFFDSALLTNISELIFDDELYALLRVCGAEESKIGETASDYDRFSAFCRITPMLTGHPILEKVASLLKECFGITLPCSVENTEEIWFKVADQLFKEPLTAWDCIKRLNPSSVNLVLCEGDSLIDQPFPKRIQPVLLGNSLLLSADAPTWSAWELMLNERLSHFVKNGCQHVCFMLDHSLSIEIPSLYHIDRVLSVRKRSDEAQALLRTQLLRFFCVACQERGLSLYLDVRCAPQSAVLLLERLEKSVVLPRITWSCTDPTVRDSMIAFALQPHHHPVTCAFLTAEYPTEREWIAAFESLIARYPYGAVTVLSGGDLRYAHYEKERFQKLQI